MQHLLSQNQDTLVKKASYLRIAARELAEGMKTGNFRSLYKGQGIEFAGVRDYIRGDDVRSIDWNVTARMGRPYVKVFEEERELQIFLIVDSSLSMQLGSKPRTKYESAAETAALIAIAAEMNNCPIGAIFFDGKLNFSLTPQLGQERTMLILTHLDKIPDTIQKGSILGNALSGAGKMINKRSLIFILSDFRSTDWEKPLISLAHKNDVIAMRIQNSFDEQLPEVGAADFIDVESSTTITLETNKEKFKEDWKGFNNSSLYQWQELCIKHGVTPVVMQTSDDPLFVLSNVFTKSGNSI
ncbi:MAG: DUF58 domain-containing protein [Treponema sp.]|nr:DUF58 domain-containing protein [Treponema sp.]